MSIDALLLKMKARQRQLWLAATIAFIVPFSVFTMLCFIVGSDFLGINVRSAPAMLGGTAITPHVYRQLVPVMANSVIAITPAFIANGVTQYMHAWLVDPRGLFATAVRFRHPASPPPELADANLYPFAVVCVIDYLFLLGYVFFVWALARKLFPQFFSAQVVAPALAILAIVPMCARFAYIYDFPVLFFSGWLTWLLIEKRLALFTLAVGLATFNKETSLYFIALFAMWGWRELPRRSLAVHLLCQCFLFVMIKGALTVYYSHNPGEFLWVRGFYDHIITNLDGYAVYNFLGVIAAILLLGYRWQAQPYVLQCWMAILPFAVLSWLIFGMRSEYRVLYEMFPALLLIATHTISHCLQGKES